MDPPKTKDGRDYGPIRFKEIVKERYLIAKNCHTSYLDVGKITPVERRYLIEFITDEARKTKEFLEQEELKRKSKSSK